MTSLLYLTDGTEVIDFLAPTSGIHLSSWSPVLPAWKGGGVWAGSPLSDGRRLAVRNFENQVDLFELKVSGEGQNYIIQKVRDLRNLLEAAVAYWTGVGDDPVYLVARGPCETNTRYAVVHGWKTDADSNPFAQPFFSHDPIDEFSLAIEHGPWIENPPGLAAGTAVEAAATHTFNAVLYGRAATTAAEVFVGNRYNDANLTHIYYYDASGAAFSGNLFGAALPYDLFPAVPDDGDILYLGSNDAVAGSGPFSSVVFDLSVGSVDFDDLEFEYWNGAWTAIPRYTDNTTRLSETGVVAFSFEQPDDWTTTAINGVNAWWIRMRIPAAGAGVAPAPPTQANRQPYAVTWPCIEVDDLQVGGDLPALARYMVYTMTSGASLLQYIYRVTAGIRSTLRGTSFRSFLNASSEQNVTGVSVSLAGSSAPVDTTSSSAPAGTAALYNPAGASDGLVAFRIAAALTGHFRGTFRAYGRVFLDSLVDDCYVNLKVQQNYNSAADYAWLSPNFYPTAGVDFEVLDFGQIDIPGMAVKPGETYTTDLTISIVNGTGSPNLWVYDLVLIPVDEWAVDTYNPTKVLMAATTMLDIDSLTSPRRRLYTDVIYPASGNLKDQDWIPVSAGPAILQAAADQKIHFFFQQWHTTSEVWYALPNMLAALQVERNQRYLSLRGDH